MKLDSRLLVPEQSSIALVRDGKEVPLVIGQDASLSARGELDGSMEAPMVFVGYGLSIPEAGWDDFAGLDLRGKIAVYVNAFPPVKVSDNVRSHVNTADERWLALKRAGAIGVATMAAPRPRWRRRCRGATPPARGAAAAGSRQPLAQAPLALDGGVPAGHQRPLITLFDRELVDAAGQKVAISLTARGAAAVLAGSRPHARRDRHSSLRTANRCRGSRFPAR